MKKPCEHNWKCEDGEVDWCLRCGVEQLHSVRCKDICEECCAHDDTPECGHCINCGAEVDVFGEPELNDDR